MKLCERRGCDVWFEPRRPHHRFHSEKCRYEAWAEERENSSEAAAQRVGGGDVHPLAEARAAQESSKLKSDLSELVYQGIISRLERGPVHADDLEPIFPPEHRGLCRRLTGAQFGSLASRHYIVERERRKSAVPSRKGAKSGVFEFTRLGREKLAGVGGNNREGTTSVAADALDRPAGCLSFPAHGARLSITADPGEVVSGDSPCVPGAPVPMQRGRDRQVRAAGSSTENPTGSSPRNRASGTSGAAADAQPGRLFELSAPRPLNPLTDAEAA